ncbi:hypothetical protein CR513_32718, partial [Mucuna pruriens]
IVIDFAIRKNESLSIIKINSPHHDKVRDLMHAIDEKFTTFDKFLTSILIMQFSFTKLTRIRGVRDHIAHKGYSCSNI